MSTEGITRQTLQRLPQYLSYLKSLGENAPLAISSSRIAEFFGMKDIVVRKDLAAVYSGGKPKIGYPLRGLQQALEDYLGYNDTDDAILVGAGKLGRALMDYKGFKEYGLNIVAAFDNDDASCGVTPSGKNILPMQKMGDLCERMKIRIGIITTPAAGAQEVCDEMVAHGVQAIWNFAPAHINAPEGILVQNENMASSLALLSHHLKEKQRGEDQGE